MPKDQLDILEILKSELEFIEKGGYGAPDKQAPEEIGRAHV